MSMSVPILIGASGAAGGGTTVAVGAGGTGVGGGSSELHATATNAIEAKAKAKIDNLDIEVPNNLFFTADTPLSRILWGPNTLMDSIAFGCNLG